MRKHVLITGTGRTGTTFLVELFTHLGFSTGFSVEDLAAQKDSLSQAGLEHDIRDDACPYIAKHPWFCDYADEVIEREDILIEHILVPIREVSAAADSRRRVEDRNISRQPLVERLRGFRKPWGYAGGLWHTRSNRKGDQELILMRQLYKLILATSKTTIPLTAMHYPRIIKDSHYLYSKLEPVLGNMDYSRFATAFAEAVKPELVTSYNRHDS